MKRVPVVKRCPSMWIVSTPSLTLIVRTTNGSPGRPAAAGSTGRRRVRAEQQRRSRRSSPGDRPTARHAGSASSRRPGCRRSSTARFRGNSRRRRRERASSTGRGVRVGVNVDDRAGVHLRRRSVGSWYVEPLGSTISCPTRAVAPVVDAVDVVVQEDVVELDVRIPAGLHELDAGVLTRRVVVR